MSGESEVWGKRARQVKLAGLSRTPTSEIAAVYAALYPTAEPVRTSCYKCVAEAFQAILRYLRTQPSDSPISFSQSQPVMKITRTHSFVNPDQTYRPHNSPVVFSNENLTDARTAMILKADPAAAAHFGLSEEDGQAFVEAFGQPEPTAEEVRADAFKQLDGLKRDELEKVFAGEVVDGQDPKSFANKTELINALLDSRAK